MLINGATTIISSAHSGNRELVNVYAPINKAEQTIDESEKAIYCLFRPTMTCTIVYVVLLKCLFFVKFTYTFPK